MSIWQELVDRHGFTGAYESVKRFVRKLRGPASPEARAVITTPPGEEAQVDYGTGPTIRDPVTGKYRRSRLFVLTLGFSRKCVRLLTFQSSTRIWAELHERAFRKLGGAVKIIVPDNLKEGVLKPDIYDPALNPLYRDVLAHYGAVVVPCRPADPDRKGKVESGVGHAQKTPLKGQRFESMEEAQTYLDKWEERWADTRIHGTTKRQVAAMFAEEKRALLPLPLEPFRYYRYGERTVHLDGCVEVEAAYYSAPPGWIGRKVHVQWDGRFVRLLDPKNGQLLREHLRGERGRHRIKEEDRPQRTPMGVVQLLARTASAGEHIGQFCKLMHSRQGEPLCGACKASCHSRRSMASPALTMPARRRSKWKRLISASCAAIWNATPSRPSASVRLIHSWFPVYRLELALQASASSISTATCNTPSAVCWSAAARWRAFAIRTGHSTTSTLHSTRR